MQVLDRIKTAFVRKKINELLKTQNKWWAEKKNESRLEDYVLLN